MIILYTAAISVSAFLLFLVQPMLAKQLMPMLGGSPAVWNTAMVFFQACLLIGYLYAHCMARYLPPRMALMLHAALLIISCSILPIQLYTPETLDPSLAPIGWILLALLFTIGLPFTLIASNAPMVQHLFSHSGHRLSHNPYPLYAASNAASFLALFAYPILVEPLFGAEDQLGLWSIGYGLFCALVIGCLLHRGMRMKSVAPVQSMNAETITAPRMRQYLYWIALALIPSSLMLGVTSYATTDIAAVPLLWIIPLALYLLSFVIAFSNYKKPYKLSIGLVIPFILILLTWQLFAITPRVEFIFLHFAAFFFVALMCHGRLDEVKPDSRYLTQFYVCLSIGGVLGGVFNSLVAPLIFDSIAEYPLMLLIACALCPLATDKAVWPLTSRHILYASACGCVLVVLYMGGATGFGFLYKDIIPVAESDVLNLMIVSSVVAFLIAAYGFYYISVHSRRKLWCVIIIFALLPFAKSTDETLFRERNFFGVSVVKVDKDKKYKEPVHMYMHGSTIHGLQYTTQPNRLAATSYYGGLKEIFDQVQHSMPDAPIAGLGLGVATIKCYAKKGQRLDFYEIDPIVIKIAKNPDFFTYLSDCPSDYQIFLGDGRIELFKQKPETYSVIILDAYSSDSLPIHLITREAVAGYLKRLRPGGLLAFNISNRHMNLAPILADIAGSLNAQAYFKGFVGAEELEFASQWVIMGRDAELINAVITEHEGWEKLQPSGQQPWSDDYSNILQALLITQDWFYPAEK